MAYRAKKKNVGSKILVWVCLFAIIASTISALIYYILVY